VNLNLNATIDVGENTPEEQRPVTSRPLSLPLAADAGRRRADQRHVGSSVRESTSRSTFPVHVQVQVKVNV